VRIIGELFNDVLGAQLKITPGASPEEEVSEQGESLGQGPGEVIALHAPGHLSDLLEVSVHHRLGAGERLHEVVSELPGGVRKIDSDVFGVIKLIVLFAKTRPL
jgi:hypothetical protein